MENTPPAKNPESRKFPRLTTDIDVVYSRAGAEDTAKVNQIKDISAGGVCIIAYDDIAIGTVLSIKFNLPETNGPINVQGKVVWKNKFTIDSLEQPRWDVGVQFIDIPDIYRDIILKHTFSSPKRKTT